MPSKIPINRKSIAQPASKLSNSQSSIPVLRRSNSQDIIKTHSRQSRSSVRNRTQDLQRTRSLAVKSPSTTSNLLHPNFGSTSNRVRSISNVRYTVTPQQQRREINPFSLEYKLRSRTKDLRPVNDKDWQRLQLAKVKSFLNELDPRLPSVKPLTILGFVTVMDLFLKHFDNRITITKENYKDEVIKYLQIFSYPVTIPPSLIKNISAPHEFPKFLAIWSWLIDRIEIIRNPDKILQPAKVTSKDVSLYHILLSYNIQKFKLWNQNKEDGADEYLRGELYAIYNINSPSAKEKQVKMLKTKVASLEQAKLDLNLEEQIKQLQKDNKERKEINEEYIQQKEFFLETSKIKKEKTLSRIKCVKQLTQVEEDKKKELENTLAAQSHDYLEFNNINKKIQEMNHTIKLYQDRLDAQNKIVSKYDEIIVATKQKVEEKIHKYNNEVTKWSLLKSNLNKLKIRETDLMELTFLDELNQTVEKKNKWIKTFEAELKKSLEAYAKMCAKNEKAALDIDNLRKEIDKKKMNIEIIRKQYEDLNNAKQAEIKTQQLHLEKLNKNLVIQNANGEKKIEECKKKVQDAAVQLANKKDFLKKHCEQSEKFFINIANSIFQTIATRREQRRSITDALTEASSKSVISEEIAGSIKFDLSTKNDFNHGDST